MSQFQLVPALNTGLVIQRGPGPSNSGPGGTPMYRKNKIFSLRQPYQTQAYYPNLQSQQNTVSLSQLAQLIAQTGSKGQIPGTQPITPSIPTQ